MRTLDKRTIRNLKTNIGQYLSIFILLTATIAFGSAFLSVTDSIETTLKDNQKESNLEDGNFTLNEKHQFSTYYKIDENYYIDLENNYTLRIYKNRDKTNKLSLFEGTLAKKNNEIALDRVFALSNNIKLNDIIKIQNYSFKVVGFISAPDYNSLFKSNNDLMMNTKDFGIGFVNEETFTKLENNYNTKYNYSYHADTNEIKNYLLNNNIKITQITPKEANQAISFLEEDLGTDVPSMKALIYIVVAIIAFVFVIIANNNIEEDAKSIGTLKAMGYKNKEIIFHYMKLPLFITLISACFGNILGYTIFIDPFKNLYYNTFSLPPLNLNLNIEAFILTTIIPILLMVIINYFLLRKKLNLKTIKFLRNDIRKSKNKNIKLSKKIPFKTRFKLRIFFDNIGNFIILFLGIFLASLLMLFSIGLKPVIKHYEDTVKKTTVAEYQYILSGPVNIDAFKLTEYQMETNFDKNNVVVNFIGLRELNKYFENLELKDIDDGIVISDSLALKKHIKIGDTLKFIDKNTDKEYEYKVLDIYEYRSSFAVFMNQSDLNKILELPSNYYNSILSDNKLDINKQFIIKEISREDVGNVAKQMLTSFEGLLGMVVLFGIVIYIVLMYILTKVIIEKYSLNISLMKVLGYNSKEIKKLYLRGTAIAVIIMLIIVMPLEKLTFDFIMEYAMGKIEGYLEVFIPLKIYITVILIGIITYFIINKFHIKKIDKIPMENALKNRE
ncbi:MAG: FtsX-like permease family protein [Bacilli bacterium]|nr:FtsX-like permease family protein [Bacilli bacterium]